MAHVRETINRHVEYLVSIQNKDDGGWGVEAGFPSSPMNTAEVMTALSRCRATQAEAIRLGTEYLHAKQLKDGGWTSQRRNVTTDSGQTVTTSWAIRALSQTPSDDEPIRRALAMIIERQRPTGAWVNHPGLAESVTATAHALLALLEASRFDKRAEDAIRKGLLWLARASKDGHLSFVQNGRDKTSATVLAAYVANIAHGKGYELNALGDVINAVKKAARGAERSLFDNQVEDETFNTFRAQYEHFTAPLIAELLAELGEPEVVQWPFLRHLWRLQEPGAGAACTAAGRRTCWATAQWLLAICHACERAANTDDLERLELPERALVMKGGGVKGLALAGALTVFEEHGIRFDVFAGTSAGAIAAVLLAAGYTGKDLESALRSLDFRRFLDSKRHIPMNLLRHGALHSGAPIQQWVRERVEERIAKQPVRMYHLGRRALVFAANHSGTVTFDSHGAYRDLPADFAARCSMSIPYFFRAHEHEGESIFDGGLLNNFPLNQVLPLLPGAEVVGLYLREVEASWLGRKLVPKPLRIMLAQDENNVVDKYVDRTVIIDPTPIGTVQFDLFEEEKDLLILRGRAAAFKFLRERYGNDIVSDDDVKTANEMAAKAAASAVARRKKARRQQRVRLVAVVVFSAAVYAALRWLW